MNQRQRQQHVSIGIVAFDSLFIISFFFSVFTTFWFLFVVLVVVGSLLAGYVNEAEKLSA